MTPLQFAREQCANWENGGSCKGIGIRDDGSLYIFGKKPACVLTDRKARCTHFEECVLPMNIEPCNAINVQRAREHQEAVNLYTAWTQGKKLSKYPICPHCRKREVIPPKRFCYVCAEDRKKNSDRLGGAERQKRARQSRKTPLKTPENIGPNGVA